MHHTKNFPLLVILALTFFFICILIFSHTSTKLPDPIPALPQTSFFGQLVNHFIPPQKPVTIALAGDVILARTVAAQAKKQGDLNYPFQKVATYLSSANIAFFNLESPITSLTGDVPINSLNFHIEPEFAPALKQSGVDIVSLANNHTPNQGESGLAETMEILKNQNIETVGAGTSSQSYQPQIVNINGQTIGFLAYTDPALVPKSYAASQNHLGTAMMDLGQMRQDIAKTKPKVDWLFVSLHSGIEFSHQPTQTQKEFAHAAIDAGADFIIGHHPHVLQPIEQYKNGVIFYSLGNFIFDQMFSTDTRQSVLVTLELTKNQLKQIKILPLMIDNYAQPRPATPQESSAIIKTLRVPENNSLFTIQAH